MSSPVDSEHSETPWGVVREWLRRRLRPRRDLVKAMEELITEGTAEGVLNADEEEMLLSVLTFRGTLVREVMVPRTEMVCAAVDDSLDRLVRIMVDEGHSRIPIHEDGVDNVVGFLTARDVLAYWDTPGEGPHLRELLRPVYFIPETMKLERLLAELKLRRTHLAVAVDEYGGVSGLVTLEDVLEEIVGEIHDEYDEDDLEIRQMGGWLRVEGRTEIEKLEDHLGVEFGEGDFETVGGLVFHALGRIPAPGETFQYEQLEITVQHADKRRVKEVRIRPLESGEPPGEGSPKDEPS